MKTNDIITADQLAEIIAQHGAGTVSVDGSMPKKFATSVDLEMNGTEEFQAVVNYDMPVQFHLITQKDGSDTIDGDFRAMVTTGLKGRLENGEWVA